MAGTPSAVTLTAKEDGAPLTGVRGSACSSYRDPRLQLAHSSEHDALDKANTSTFIVNGIMNADLGVDINLMLENMSCGLFFHR